MQQTIYFNYSPADAPADPSAGDVAGADTNAYSVTLASQDGTFGIQTADGVLTVVPSDTSVSNPSIGLYQYTFEPETGIVYLVSWKVIGNEGDAPEYTLISVGPFYDADSVRVRPNTKGTFTQGTYGTVCIQIYNHSGGLVDGENVRIMIRDSETQTVYVQDNTVKLTRGTYLYDWPIPGMQPAGLYDVIWTYTVNGKAGVICQKITVGATGGNGMASGIMAVMRIKLEQMLHGIQNINMKAVPSDETDDHKTYSFHFRNWNQSSGVKVYRNQRLISQGFDVDYLNGLIIFDKTQLEQDQVHADFRFRFFSDDELDLFLLNGLNAFNIFPPHTGAMCFTYLPDHYVPPVLYGAAVDAIRTFGQAIIWPENRVLFESPEVADKAFDRYNTINEGYEKKWETLCDNKKLFPYKGLNRLMLQSMYALPGGRARFFRYLFGGGF